MMCEGCGERQRSYDWARDRDGKPKLTPNNSYMMVDDMGAYFGFNIETLPLVRKLLDEIEAIES